jgi:UDP-N-acetylglucosamine:LPS N-acetylglucosamine transferase
MMKKNIGIFSTKQGHQSIAEAIKEKIEAQAGDRYQVEVFYNKQIFETVYESLYRLAPSILKVPYDLSVKAIEKDAELSKLIFNIFFQYTYEPTSRLIKEKNIDLAISCYFPFNPALKKIKETKNIPCLNIITDPRTIHPWQIFHEAEANFFFENKNLAKYKKTCKAKAAGWFVGKKFETNYQKKGIKKKLKINEQLVFLIASGSDGSAAVLKVLAALINCPKPVRIFIACGNNRTLYNNILGIKKSLNMFSQSKAVITPLPFTKELHLYMQAADLIIGKAGPNTLFESAATLTPFFAITHIAQEAGNLEIIKEYKLGFVEEKTKAANQKLLEIIKKPQELEKFQTSLKKLKEHNRQSASILIEEIDKIFK